MTDDNFCTNYELPIITIFLKINLARSATLFKQYKNIFFDRLFWTKTISKSNSRVSYKVYEVNRRNYPGVR